MTERNARKQGRRFGLTVALAIAGAGLAIAGGLLVADAVAQAPQPRVQVVPPNGRIVQFGKRLQIRVNDQVDVDGADGVFLPQDRDATRQLERAKQLLDDARYSDAATLLDDILKRGEDYFYKPDSRAPIHRSLKMEAQRLIGNMPPEGLKAYELQFGVRARQMLSEAAAEGDVAKLEAIARRFFHTEAGYQATLLLGRRYLDHAQPLAAALCFQRLLDISHVAAPFEPALSIMAATSWLRGGMAERAGEVLVALKKKNPQAVVRLGAERAPAFSDGRTAAAWLQSAIGRSQKSTTGDAQQWAMHRGNPSRNSLGSGGMPLLNPRWRVSTTNHPTLEKSLVELRKRYAEDGVAPLPVMQPLAVGNLVLMRTPREVLAVDFVTGKRLWPIRTSDTSWDARPESASPFVQPMFEAQSNPALTDRFWTDATQGTLSSDGVRVYLIQDAIDRSDRRDVVDRQIQMQVEFARPYNKLTACELHTQGKLKWEVGGATGEDEPQLAGAFFLGPPLPLQGQLYVLAEINGEIKLWVLDAATGRVEWSQQLAVVEQTILQDSLRTLAGCTPSFADGILVCPTAAGAVVGVDMTNRSLLWAFQYPRSAQAYPHGIPWRGNPFGVPQASSGVVERWNDSAAIIADGRVLISPPESDELHCLSLVDGKPQWKPAERGENLYIGGVHRGNVILIGKRGVNALRLADGQPAWKQPIELPEGALPSGRGYLSDNEFYLPLTTAEVARIDLSAEKITHRARSRKGSIPGNLICFRGEVISQGIDYVETFHQLAPLQKQIAEALAADPNDAWALAHRGEIALEGGDLAQAVSDIRRAYQSEPTPFTRDLLVEAFVAALAEDFNKYQEFVAELEPLVQFDPERARLLRVVAAGLHQQGKTSAALNAYLKLAELPLPPDDELDEIDAERRVRRDRWIRANVNELIAAARPEDRTKIDALVEGRLDAAVAERGPRSLRQFLSYFGDHPAADRARELLVDQTSGPTVLLEREQLLRRLEQSSDTARRKEAMVKLAALLRDAGQEHAALAYYRKLAAEFGDGPLGDGKTVGEMLEELPRESPLRRAASRGLNWPDGEVVVEKGIRAPRTASFVQPFQPIEIHGARGPFFEKLTIGWYPQSGGDLVVRDGWGGERFRFSLADQQRGAYNPLPNVASAMVHGHLLVLYTGSQVVGIDTLRLADGAAGRILWRQDIGDPSGNNVYIEGGGGRIRWNMRGGQRGNNAQPGCLGVAGANGIFIQRGRDVVALDPLSGKPLWTRQVTSPNCEIFGDDEIILVAPLDARDRKALVLRAVDGHELGQRALPAAEQRWATYGRCVLAWHALPDGKQQLRLVDPWGNRDVWSATFTAGVKGTGVDDETIALMQPDGRFVALSIADGRTVIDEKLEAEPKLESIYVLRSAGQDVLIVNRPMNESQGAARKRRHIQTPHDSASPLVTGRIYAFNRETGKLQWATPGSVEEQGLLVNQPSELPVLLFMRNVADPDGGGQNPRGSILCIDKRTGRLIYEDDNLPQQNTNFEAVANLDDKTVTLNMLQQTVTLKFTDNPVAPEPPYQARLSNPKWSAEQALRRAWRMATEPEAAPVKINHDPFAPAEGRK